jgi:hypothetical protein
MMRAVNKEKVLDRVVSNTLMGKETIPTKRYKNIV